MSATARRVGVSGKTFAPLTWVQSATLVWLLVAAVCAVWSIHERLPYGFAGHGSPNRVASEFLTNGTALAPPLTVMLVALVAAVVAATRRRALGSAGDLVLVFVAVISIVGIFGEPTFRRGFEPGHVHLDQDVLRIAAIAVTLGLFAAAARELAARLRGPSARQA